MPTASKPMLFSAPMVRAILEGRKTQTRRVIKNQPPERNGNGSSPWNWCREERVGEFHHIMSDDPSGMFTIKCPHPAGSEIWVRETWGYTAAWPPFLAKQQYMQPQYRADNPEGGFTWFSPIFMPRWASRITLTVESVRVERLQDIGEDDAFAEGCFALGDCECTAVRQYSELWERINGHGSWALNPWVFVYTFKITDKEQAR